MTAAPSLSPGLPLFRPWLLARRAVQFGVLGLFLAGPLFGWWVVKGTLAASLLLGTVPLSDPLIVLQSLLAGHWPAVASLTGAGLVTAAYLLVGGRSYCAWVCPVNLLTDLAGALRRRFGLRPIVRLDRRLRQLCLVAVLAASAATGTIVWETVNPVTLLQRGLVTGTVLSLGAASLVAAAVFLADLGLGTNGWCGALCPVGAFYALLGRWRLLRVAARRPDACDRCAACAAVCPEPQLLAPMLRGEGGAPVISSGLCSNCGGCIDVCHSRVFGFALRRGKGEGRS